MKFLPIVFLYIFMSAQASHRNVIIDGGTDETSIGNTGDRLKVDSAVAANTVSTANSSTSNLSGDAVFTGSFEEILSYTDITAIVKSDVAGTLTLQWSADGATVVDSDSFAIAANTGKQYSFGSMAKYVRIVYTNGSNPQTSFILQTIYKRSRGKPSSHRVEDSIIGDDDVEVVKAVITGKSPDTTYKNVSVDENGNLITTSLSGFGSDFSFGDVNTSTTTQVSVRRTTYTEQTTNAQRSFSSSDVDDDGSPADTGARTLRVTYLNASGAGPSTEDVILNGTTCVATISTTIAFVEKIEVLTVGSTASNEGTISMFVNASCGGGTIGTIAVNNNQTFWGHHYIPVNKVASITGISAGSTSTVVGGGGLFILKAKSLSVADAVEEQVSDFVRLYGQSSTFSRSYQSPIRVTGPARVLLYVTPETGTTTTYRAAIDFFEQ